MSVLKRCSPKCVSPSVWVRWVGLWNGSHSFCTVTESSHRQLHNFLFPLSPIKWTATLIKPPLENWAGLSLWNMIIKKKNKESKFVSRRLTVITLQMQGCPRCTSCCSLGRSRSVYSPLWKAAVPPVFLLQSVRPSSVMEADTPCHFILTFWKAVWFFCLSHFVHVSLCAIKFTQL